MKPESEWRGGMNDIIYMTDENGDLAIMWFGRVLARVQGTQPYTSVIDVSTPAMPMLVEHNA
jgi:hypothetical protein